MAKDKLKYKDLIKLVSSTSKYHLYEVEDVLSHLIYHMREEILNDKEVKLPGLGIIHLDKFTKRFNLTNEIVQVHRLMIKSDTIFKKESQEEKRS